LRHTGSRIHDPDQHLRLVDRDACLFQNVCRNHSVVVRHDPAGVDEGKLHARPFDLPVNSIARDARLVADDGSPFSDKTVEKGGLPDVRPPHDRYQV
jgi:hypothetical protein